ncbi:MAG: hypothetical protein LUH05_02925 [Candidatus Gastranaerophilales bacterium]|nr:hypothetical protein [Candidatus Gastranaerophilales bacterium]
MKIGTPKVNQYLASSLEKFSEKGGEKVSNYVNAAGKIAVAPLVIMHNPFTNEDKDNRKWAAIKQPVEAVISIAMQIAGLSLLYKGIDSLIKKGKINFKFVEEASKDVSKIPDKIMKACSNDKDKALKMYKEQYEEIFKDRIGAVLTAATYVPVLAVSNKIYPKIADKLVNKNDNKSAK